MLHPIGARLIDCARLSPGMRVVDIGCGCSEFTRQLARAVGPSGGVLAIDPVAEFVDDAARAAARLGLSQIEFMQADAAEYPYPGDADAVVSRLAIMLLADLSHALPHVATALRPGGRLVFAVWGPHVDNDWWTLPLAVRTQVIGHHAPALLSPTNANVDGCPGPFRMADAEDTRRLLQDAGFAQIDLTDVQEPLWFGANVDATVAFFVDHGGAAMRAALSAAAVQDLRSALRSRLAPYRRPDGVYLPARLWVGTARKG